MMSTTVKDAIGPFLKELQACSHFFHWDADRKTGRIFGRHCEYDASFTVIEAVAWAETGKRYEDQFHAARAVGLTAIVDAVRGATETWNNGELRRGVLVSVGLVNFK